MKVRWNELVLGPAKDPLNPRVFHTLTLAAFLAWVGLGADGLSSSCYGPEEAFLALGEHRHLALPLAAFMALTVVVISASYSLLIELFPTGGGGYVVTTKLLGKDAGVVCGCALILDYILTIAISATAGIDAIFSFLPASLATAKPLAVLAALVVLIVLNLRGVKESIVLLLPIFVVFLLTHVIAIASTLIGHAADLPRLIASTPGELAAQARTDGWFNLSWAFFLAYSIGGGTYTGIEAVSNSMQILREPRVATGKRTMFYMAISLAITASGLLVGYLLWDVKETTGKTLNAVLFETLFAGFRPGGIPVGQGLIVATLLAEGALLFVAAQAGFIGGPRTLATMALDRWVPTRFSHLSTRLVIQDGVLFMGLGAVAFVVFTGASVKLLVILYSINVFLTFTLSQLGMCVHWLRVRAADRTWKRKLAINGFGLLLTAVVLVMMIAMKFNLGGWVTLAITAAAVILCYLVRRHYEDVRRSIQDLDTLLDIPVSSPAEPPPKRLPGPTAVLLVGGFNGLGMHSFLAVLRLFPHHFKNFLFVSVGVVDFEEFKGVEEIEHLKDRTADALEKYVERARGMGLCADYRWSVGAELLPTVEALATEIVKEVPGAIFFGGKLVFENENLFTRSLHSQAAFEIQRRFQFAGLPMVLLPIRVRPEGPKKA